MIQQGKTGLKYRPDIDGLRAIAVLLVLFNHLGTRGTGGGYIGVDVFFVISGYLISSVILSEMSSGRFTLINFYERRIRRILPALLVVLLGTAVAAWFYFVPSETEDFARSSLAALFSVSNLLFWHQAGYFDAPSRYKPLLHTWSLAVEEQFYLFFPLFLMAVRRWFPNLLRAAVWGITVITFALACVWVQKDPTAAFYVAPLRAWELLIGVIVSQHYVPAINGKWPRNVAAAAGLLLILAPSKFYNADTPFPGLAALPPCLGAALFIAAGETGKSLAGRLLSWRPIVFIGLISYSLYLWHWPIIVFLGKFYRPSSPQFRAIVIGTSLVGAILSWLFVETPFRKGRFRPNRVTLFRVVGLAAAAIGIIGVVMVTSGGLPSRFPPEALAADSYTNFDPTAAFRANKCFIDPLHTPGGASFDKFDQSTCLIEDPARKNYLLFGDSHAAHLYPGLRAVFPELNILQANAGGCGPLLPPSTGTDSYCMSMRRYIYNDYLAHHHVDAVLLSGRWSDYLKVARDKPDLNFQELERTLAWFRRQGIEVILFGTGIEFDVNLPRFLTFALRNHDVASINQHRNFEQMQIDEKLSNMARNKWKVRYISTYEDLCDPKTEVESGIVPRTSSGCPIFAGSGVPLLFDTNHFTPPASTLFAKTIRDLHQLP